MKPTMIGRRENQANHRAMNRDANGKGMDDST